MITVKGLQPGFIKMTGHADYGPSGKDIVCAGVSALTYAFAASLNELGGGCKLLDDGKELNIVYKASGKEASFLTDAFFIGLELIAREYPKNVQIERKRPSIEAVKSNGHA